MLFEVPTEVQGRTQTIEGIRRLRIAYFYWSPTDF